MDNIKDTLLEATWSRVRRSCILPSPTSSNKAVSRGRVNSSPLGKDTVRSRRDKRQAAGPLLRSRHQYSSTHVITESNLGFVSLPWDSLDSSKKTGSSSWKQTLELMRRSMNSNLSTVAINPGIHSSPRLHEQPSQVKYLALGDLYRFLSSRKS